MPHASLMDVFNAGTQAASPFFQYGTEKLKEQNDLQLKQNATRFVIDVENYLRDNPYNGNYDEYVGKMRDYTDKWYALAAGKNSSPYFQKNIQQMKEMSLLQVDDLALRQEDAFRVEQAGVDYTNAITRIKNSSNLTTQSALDAMMVELENYSASVGLTPAGKAKETGALYTALYDKALTVDVGYMTVEDAHKKISENIENLETIVNQRDLSGEGENILDKWLPDKEGSITKAKTAARIAVWNRDYNEIATANAEYLRIAGDAGKSGDQNLIRTALELWDRGSEMREAAMDSPDYNPDDKPKIAGMFPLMNGLSDRQSGGAGEKPEDWLKSRRAYRVQTAVEGRASFEEAYQGFSLDVQEEAKRTTGGNIDELERRDAKEINFVGMYTDVKDMLLKVAPEYKGVLDGLDTYVNEWAKEAKSPEEKALRLTQGNRIGQLMIDTVLDASGSERPSPEQVERNVRNLTGLLIAGKVAFMKETADNSNQFVVGGNSDRDFGKAVYEMAQHPEARFVTNGNVYTFGDSNYMKQFEDAAMENFSRITGIPAANLTIGHSKEGQSDEAAELNIVVSGRGEENNTYRFVAEQSGDYHIEEHTGEGWKESEKYQEMARGAARTERRRAAEEDRALKRTRDEENALRLTRENIEWLREHQGEEDSSERADMLRKIKDEELWKAGLNTFGKETRVIPAKVWDDILHGMNEDERAKQEQKWQQMGIRRVGR